MGPLLRTTSFLTSIVLLVLGLACLTVYLGNRDVPCGDTGGKLVPIPTWAYIAGVSYIIIGSCTLLVTIIFCVCGHYYPLYWVFLVGVSFTIVCTAIGYVSWLEYGSNCFTLNWPIWIVSVVTIIVSTVCIPISVVLFIISLCC